MKYLVTGAAGFIGYHVAARLLAQGHSVVGVDNLNDYYDVELKKCRLTNLLAFEQFDFRKLDIADDVALAALFASEQFTRVIHLAAQAGVRYSIDNPEAYVSANLVGYFNILQGCRQAKVEHLIYASSSSVYGANKSLPFKTTDSVDHPVSFYAATKKANELMAHAYSHLYDIPTTGLRFFTVYGPWGRPDMALFKFTDAIYKDKPIDIYNHGVMSRDFTYIDDVVEALVRVADLVPQKDNDITAAPYKIYNIGNSSPVKLMDCISALENSIGKVAIKNYLPMQAGDVTDTYSDNTQLYQDINYTPKIGITEGVAKFVAWYQAYYQR
ncbi:NAD-dependent epimerase [Serratia microhaemolytica]|uniref:NAD-dependent epimerase n=1 Tax=Serratia microhaemolytica TaxID=2675110 RepID=UPI000FDEE624|nr:NAD-dependent epimerase [Serratia microhaemolytica]